MTHPRNERPWSKAGGPEGPWDYVVIGSGMGGMTSAAFLAKLGKKVLVLEQHYVPGGFTHVFTRKGFHWDVGVHAVGEVTRHTLPGRLLHHLTDGKLTWASLGPVYDAFHFPDGFHIDFPDNPTQFRANLVAAFPDEVLAIDDYLRYVREVAGSMRGYYLSRLAPPRVAPLTDRMFGRQAKAFLSRRTREVVAELTDDPRLRTIFTAQWGYYGAPPSRSSFAMQALVVRHFLHGGYYPVGGSGEIALQLLRTVADAGGWTRISADVEQILVEGGRAVGVRLVGGEEIRAHRIVSAVGVQATAERLLPPALRTADWSVGIRALDPGPAHVCLYIGFKGDIRKAGATAANQWFYDTWDSEDEAWQVDPAAETTPRAPVLYCSFPSLKDPTHDPGPEQLHTGEIVTFVPWNVFEPWRDAKWRRRGPDYEAFKERLSTQLLKQLLEHRPELAPLVAYTELGTPVSTDHFVRPMRGSIYGLEPTPERFANPWLRPRSPVPGLYLAGSEVASVGVIGAMMGGALSAVAAEPVAALRALRRLNKAP